MNLPNTLTVIRIILAPIFFAAFFFSEWTGAGHIVLLVVLALVFAVMEVSDFLDGYFARKYQLVTEIGKVIDPFGDVMSRMTYFFCFTLIGLMPAWIFLILLYRELGITFLRMLMIRRGIAMAASIWGSHRNSAPNHQHSQEGNSKLPIQQNEKNPGGHESYEGKTEKIGHPAHHIPKGINNLSYFSYQLILSGKISVQKIRELHHHKHNYQHNERGNVTVSCPFSKEKSCEEDRSQYDSNYG